jgi:hypothetical protein
VIHLRAHPCELQTGKDWEKLRCQPGHVCEVVSLGRLQSSAMADLATKALVAQAVGGR